MVKLWLLKISKTLDFSTFNFSNFYCWLYIAPYKTPKQNLLGSRMLLVFCCCTCRGKYWTDQASRRNFITVLWSVVEASCRKAGRQAGRPPSSSSSPSCTDIFSIILHDHRPTTTSNGSLFASDLPSICISTGEISRQKTKFKKIKTSKKKWFWMFSVAKSENFF